MRTTIGVLAAVLLLMLVSGAQGARASRPLTMREAVLNLRLQLAIDFGATYIHGYDRHMRCTRATATSARCTVAWIAGDLAFRGRARIWTDPVGFSYAWTIRQTDIWCASHGGRRCVRTHVVR